MTKFESALPPPNIKSRSTLSMRAVDCPWLAIVMDPANPVCPVLTTCGEIVTDSMTSTDDSLTSQLNGVTAPLSLKADANQLASR